MKVFISFDKYYDVLMYNDFLSNLRKNGVEYKEYIAMRPPYYFYIEIDSKYKPVFLRYTEASKGMQRYLLEKVKGFMPNDKVYLERKPSDSLLNYEKYISPTIFQEAKTAPYVAIFRYKNKDQLIKISRDLGIRIYVLGKQREWNLAMTFNKYIQNYIYSDWILIQKTDASKYSKPGELEEELNFKKLVKVRLTDKYLNYPYFDSGIYYPMKKNPDEG